jgi:HlyD family secretion protein
MTQNVVLYTIEINIDNPEKLLLPYLTANVHFQLTCQTNALLVPNAALRWSPSSLAEIAPDARSGASGSSPVNDPPAADPPPMKEKGQSHKTLWIKDCEFVRPIEVIASTTDGANTAVTAAALREGQEVVTGEIAASAQSDVKNPFLPKVIRR